MIGTQSNINLSSAGNSLTNLLVNNSELGKYNVINVIGNLPYSSNHQNQQQNIAQIARDSIGFKSHEVRTKNIYTKGKKRNSGESLQFFNNKTISNKKAKNGLIVKNTSSTAYTRADKLTNYPVIDNGQSNTIKSNGLG